MSMPLSWRGWLPAVLGLLLVPVVMWPVFAQDAPVPTEPKLGVVTGVPTEAPYGGNLIVRLGSSLQSGILGYVSNGDEVTIEAQEGMFYKISAPQAGYIWTTYVRVTEERPAPKTKNEPWALEETVSATKLPANETPAPDGKKFRSSFDEGMQKDFEQHRAP